MKNRIFVVPTTSWNSTYTKDLREAALHALEQGQVLHFPNLPFMIAEGEKQFLDPSILKKSKNVGFNPDTNKLSGTHCEGRIAERLRVLISRYADAAQSLFQSLLPHYGAALKRQKTSLRPAEVAGRVTSWRKDDTRLHVDSFPSQPVRGRRILRIFCNVNPQGRARTWRVGEPFSDVANRFWSKLTPPFWLQRRLLSWFRVTKGLRSPYDHYMLGLHDAMKKDEEYQRNVPQEKIDFPSGTAWACFTDQVSHAAMAGQHQFEQTFSVAVDAMWDRSTAPLSVLEQLAGRPLVVKMRRQALVGGTIARK